MGLSPGVGEAAAVGVPPDPEVVFWIGAGVPLPRVGVMSAGHRTPECVARGDCARAVLVGAARTARTALTRSPEAVPARTADTVGSTGPRHPTHTAHTATKPATAERKRHMTGEYSRALEGDFSVARTPDQSDPAPRSLRFDIVTLFPAMFEGPFAHSMIRRARDAGLVSIHLHDLRHWSTDRHHTTDDYAYGGGGGMVLKAEPVFRAVEELLGLPPVSAESPRVASCPIVLLSPQGAPFSDARARELALHDRIIILCGHYEGFDERIRQHLATEEISVGDFVVTGGEIPAMLVTDAVARLRPGVLGLASGTDSESFANGLLEHPHYTRPADFRGFVVPDVLVGGHHAEVAMWRRRESLLRTLQRRPDRLPGSDLTDEERRWVADAGLTR